MRHRKCKQCGISFSTTDRRRKFCSLACVWNWRRTQDLLPGAFTKGSVPWNHGTKGVMKRNSGSFKKGQPCKSILPVGSETLRVDKNGKLRCWIKIAENGTSYDWILKAVHVWQQHHGKIAKGIVIHHKDRNPLNDNIDNLQAMTRREHIREHRAEIK